MVEVHGAASMVGQDSGSTMVVLAVRVTSAGADSAILGYGVEYFDEDGNKATAQVVVLDDDLPFKLPQGSFVFRRDEMFADAR